MERIYKISVNNLLALTMVYAEDIQFEQKLIDFITEDYSRVYKLCKISKGEFLLSEKVKKFYKENKKIIDAINEYYDIGMFITNNYIPKNDDLEFFKQYILKNINRLNLIKLLLLKMKRLNIKELEFNENINFTNNEYSIDPFFTANYNGIRYVDNIEVVPNYDSDKIKYKTSGSNYEILVKNIVTNFYPDKITVNSLLFDPETLPEVIDKETIFDNIKNMKDNQQKNYDILKKAVDLRLNVEELCLQFEDTIGAINKIEEVKNKEELQELLLNISEVICTLANISHEYDEEVVQKNPSITHELLKKEKELCLKRKNTTKYEI